MPTYEYECSKCGRAFEHFQSMTAEPLTDCLDPECGGKGTMKRLIGAGGGLIFKGSGFYATDYKKSSAALGGNGQGSKSSADEKKSDSPACDSCPAAKGGSCPGKG